MIVIAEIQLSEVETHRLLRLLLAADGAPGHWEAAGAIIFAGIRRPEATPVLLTPLMRSAVQSATANEATPGLRELRLNLSV